MRKKSRPHDSPAIAQNARSLEQVTAVLHGKQVLVPPKDIAEVKNAREIYGWLDELDHTLQAIC